MDQYEFLADIVNSYEPSISTIDKENVPTFPDSLNISASPAGKRYRPPLSKQFYAQKTQCAYINNAGLRCSTLTLNQNGRCNIDLHQQIIEITNKVELILTDSKFSSSSDSSVKSPTNEVKYRMKSNEGKVQCGAVSLSGEKCTTFTKNPSGRCNIDSHQIYNDRADSKFSSGSPKSGSSLGSSLSSNFEGKVQCEAIVAATGLRCKTFTRNESGRCNIESHQKKRDRTSKVLNFETSGSDEENYSETVQCAAVTIYGERCSFTTTNENGYCNIDSHQRKANSISINTKPKLSSIKAQCGAMTAHGERCANVTYNSNGFCNIESHQKQGFSSKRKKTTNVKRIYGICVEDSSDDDSDVIEEISNVMEKENVLDDESDFEEEEDYERVRDNDGRIYAEFCDLYDFHITDKKESVVDIIKNGGLCSKTKDKILKNCSQYAGVYVIQVKPRLGKNWVSVYFGKSENVFEDFDTFITPSGFMLPDSNNSQRTRRFAFQKLHRECFSIQARISYMHEKLVDDKEKQVLEKFNFPLNNKFNGFYRNIRIGRGKIFDIK
ncbi:hypothetical protein HK099_002925 [Clydaea vesicula]|uniref:Uncharacterized protein n=1 Tax=Clydaea vesicula TaxID=447962 RepID=A0AAD5XZ56_9FUNG|nr:hypothetical protein HK099_002925 [Clydaea vesicula]